jgi:hypothetical protein
MEEDAIQVELLRLSFPSMGTSHNIDSKGTYQKATKKPFKENRESAKHITKQTPTGGLGIHINPMKYDQKEH